MLGEFDLGANVGSFATGACGGAAAGVGMTETRPVSSVLEDQSCLD